VSSLRLTIGELSKRTGLSTHTIRAWEKRYGAITPERTNSNQRLYAPEQLERLQLLRRATENDHSISRVAQLSNQELATLISVKFSSENSSGEINETDWLSECFSCIDRLDEDSLSQCLNRALVILGIEYVIDRILMPLLTEIGERWSKGSLRIYQEHMATAVLRTFLADLLASMKTQSEGRRIVVTTPKNQHHEIGALLAAITCASYRWNVIYLGPNLPCKEIADAAVRSNAHAIALSIVYPLDDAGLADELKSLRSYVGTATPIFVGGSGLISYEEALLGINALTFYDWKSLGDALQGLR
jgi:DNA-binding transcriptional MerR regulator/methylmalonyl-CoA mutase cobalamin-binding subunit